MRHTSRDGSVLTGVSNHVVKSASLRAIALNAGFEGTIIGGGRCQKQNRAATVVGGVGLKLTQGQRLQPRPVAARNELFGAQEQFGIVLGIVYLLQPPRANCI